MCSDTIHITINLASGEAMRQTGEDATVLSAQGLAADAAPPPDEVGSTASVQSVGGEVPPGPEEVAIASSAQQAPPPDASLEGQGISSGALSAAPGPVPLAAVEGMERAGAPPGPDIQEAAGGGMSYAQDAGAPPGPEAPDAPPMDDTASGKGETGEPSASAKPRSSPSTKKK